MYTSGFVAIASDVVVEDVPFEASINGITQNVVSGYISVGGAGDIVWRNQYGDLNWLPGAQASTIYTIGATEIVGSGTVNGTLRTTSATNMVWMAIGVKSNY